MRRGTRIQAVALALIAVLGVPAGNPVRADGVTTVRGKVIFEGDPAKYKRSKIDRSAYPPCEKSDKEIKTEDVVLNEDTDPVTIRDVVVSIQSGLSDYAFPVPKEPAILMIHGCRYKPHVLALRARQQLRVYNGDEASHATEFAPKTNRPQLLVQPAKDLEEGRTTELVAEPPFPIKSKFCPWMSGWIAVFDHPFFSVTGRNGMFEIRGLPPGSYRLDAWHPKFGVRTKLFTIEQGGTVNVDFTFEPDP